MDENGMPEDMFSREDLARRRDTQYELDESEENSLKQIKAMVKGNLYRSKEQAHEHLLYLEHLENKLRTIFSAEQSRGISNEPLSETMRQISTLFRQVKQKQDRLQEEQDKSKEDSAISEGMKYVFDPQKEGRAKSGGSFQGVPLG